MRRKIVDCYHDFVLVCSYDFPFRNGEGEPHHADLIRSAKDLLVRDGTPEALMPYFVFPVRDG